MKKKSTLFPSKEIFKKETLRTLGLLLALTFISMVTSYAGVHSMNSLISNSPELQQSTVSGTVTDATTKEALVGVTIVIKGTTVGVVSDAQGKFKIDVPANAVLSFSFVGYNPEEVTFNGQSTLNVQLVPGLQKLDEVVVVGYGTQSKKSLTGSVATVGYDKFKDRSYSNISQALSGQLPGVSITQSQGAPGSSPIIKIRGSSSLTAGTTPLYVVDGMPMENFNLNMINSQDIASVDVLKDASSAAIYGSRGANGVILITTKLGKPGKTNINFTYEYGIQSVPRLIDMMNAQQFIQYYIDAHNNAWVASGAGRLATDPNSVRPTKYTIYSDFTDPNFLAKVGNGTNWQDVAFKSAPSSNYQMSISGGTENTQYLVSASYLDQTAVLDNNFYKRLALRTNVKQKLSDRFTIGTNLSFTGINDRTDGTLGKVDVTSLALQSDPIFPVYNENGNLGYRDPNSTWYRFAGGANDLALWNTYSMTREISKLNKTFNTIATGYIDVKLTKDLKFRSSINGNLSNGRFNGYQSTNQGYGYGTNAGTPLGISSSTYSFNWLTENTLNYEKQLGDHNIKALLGYTAQKQRDEFAIVTANTYPNDQVQTLNAGSANFGSTNVNEWSMLSYLGRVNYNYKNKYFVTGSLRRDGSSRFGSNNKWGYFPSASAAWSISDEDFMKAVTPVSNLKLKVSYGLTGNNQIPNYGPVGLLGGGNGISITAGGGVGANYVFGSTLANGLVGTNIANLDLRWEKTAQLNLGIELGLLKNRINIGVEYYNSITKDLLLNLPVPDITGFSTALQNIGRLRNRGIELNINTHNLEGKFTWTTDFNLSANRNRILQLGAGNTPIMFSDGFGVVARNEVGKSMNNFYGWKFIGVYKDQADLSSSAHVATALPGDPKIKDINGDGLITDADKCMIGNAQPDAILGMTNTFGYQGFEFSFMLQSQIGGTIVNEEVRYNAVWNGGRNQYAEVANYWKSPTSPGDGKHFRPSIDINAKQNEFSTFWLYDASFLRVKNIRLSYALPSKWVSRLKIQTVRVYINIENALLFSKYKTGYDPENTTYNATTYSATSNASSGAPGSATQVISGGYNSNTSNPTLPSGAFAGVDYGSYPIPRVVTYGIKLDF